MYGGDVNALLVSDKERIKETRSALTSAGYYDTSRRITQTEEGYLALPITSAAVDQLVPKVAAQNEETSLPSLASLPVLAYFNGTCYALTFADLPLSKKAVASAKTCRETLRMSIQKFLSCQKPPLNGKKCKEMLLEVPTSWERHGDLVVLPSQAFRSPDWKQDSFDFWSTVAAALNCCRLARDSEIVPDKYRSSGAEMLLGTDPWVEHVDNGVKYVFDVTRIMFSSGNITEKLRVAQLDCSGETVVDLYAGIGYFTLPYLVHAHAKTVHACEWNERAVEGLKRGLVANGVEERCVVYVGDCRQVCPRGIADRVNLGLIPSSESGWLTACAALRPDTGGWLHIHGNVSCRPGDTFRGVQNPWENSQRQGTCRPGDTFRGPWNPQTNSKRQGVEAGDGDGGGRRIQGDDKQVILAVKSIPGGWEKTDESDSSKEIEGSGALPLLQLEVDLVSSDSLANTCPAQHKDSSQSVGEVESRSEKDEAWPCCSDGSMDMSRRKAKESWKCYLVQTIRQLLSEGNPLHGGWRWDVRVGRVGSVKSYAPFVDHLVADVECRPIPSTGTA